MRWLFIRFYIGIAVVLLVAAGFFFLRIQSDYEKEQIAKRNERSIQFLTPWVDEVRKQLADAPADDEERTRLIKEIDFRQRPPRSHDRPRREPPKIDLMPLESLDLAEETKRQLKDGDIVIVTEGEKRTFHAIVPGGEVLTLESRDRRQPDRDEDPSGENIWLLLAPSMGILMLIGVAIFYLIRPIERRIAALTEVTRSFGAGALDTRANVGSSGAMDELEESFNAMAGRIEELVDGQRELLRAVSHDLRTPLARIFFTLDEAQTAESAELKNEHLHRIDGSMVELNNLVEELTTYLHLDSGAVGPVKEWIDVASIMRHATELVADLGPEIALDLQCDEAQVFAEPNYLKRAVGNLVTNAITHAKQGIWITCRSEAGDFLLNVADDGPGIPEEDRERVFEPFFRRERSRNMEWGGSGLGLAIVARIMAWHNGTVEVSESSRHGALFTMTFPKENLEDKTGSEG